MSGICAYGGYVPRYRINRKLIFESIGWMNPATIALTKGEKAVANFDEDSITMAVAACTDVLYGIERSNIGGLYFASTTMPYKERLNAGIIASALALNNDIRSTDYSGSTKSGTSALLSALEGVESKRVDNIMVSASDCRLGKPSSSQEMLFGDAAAALLVGKEKVIAEFKGSHSITYDFCDHFRGEYAKYDRSWEDRWARDLGYDRFIPEVINGLLTKYQLKIEDFSKVVYPCYYPAERKKLNTLLGVKPEIDQDNLQAEIGESGTPHSLVMLVKALEESKSGDRILVVSYGNGCDALVFEVTDEIEKKSNRNSLSECLANRAELDNYSKYLVWRNILPGDLGLRSEEDIWTRWSTLWRRGKFILGLWGSKCQACGTPQLPPQRICVNPDCGKIDKMEAYLFSDKIGQIVSYTGDMLAASYNPPSIYGQIEFEGGGKYMFDLADCDLNDLATGMAVSMSFRRKYYDEKRDISGYFWKAVPVKEVY